MAGAADALRPTSFSILAIILLIFVTGLHASDQISGDGDGRQVYIVYMGHRSGESPSTSEAGLGFSAAEAAHHELLNRVLDDSSAHERIIYSYQRSLSGFAARLTQDEKQKLSSKALQVTVHLNQEFLGYLKLPH